MSYFRNKYLTSLSDEEINYKNLKLLKKCITPESGRMIPARLTRCSRVRQKKITKAVKIARYLGLIPYLVD